jgi:hypothetical protein
MTKPPRLKLIHGGRSRERRVGGVRVCAAPLDQPPFEVDAVVYQEDTFGVLAAPGDVRPTDDHPIRVFHDAARLEPSALGAVFVVEEQPLRIHAVVCDLDADEPCCEKWVGAAFTEVLRVVEERELAHVSAEILGAAYGHMPIEAASAVLMRQLQRLSPTHLTRLWLIVPGGIEPGRVFGAGD